jgi:hypothetical protein
MHFFLNLDEALKGTNQIGNYVVLVNEIDYTLKEVEELTYALCHTDQPSTKTEVIPSRCFSTAQGIVTLLFDDYITH